MEEMGSYFKKWKEWRNRDLGNKSPASIKGAEEEKSRDNQLTNQSTQQFNLLNVNVRNPMCF